MTTQPIASTIVSPAVSSRRLVGLWLFTICGLIALMVVVGGATRLTDSGLSITEWRPVTGAVPPLSAVDWRREFAKYQEIPQYKLVNRGMNLDQFKAIYWWEWAHRLLGRLIGVVFAIPFLWFAFTRRLGPKLIGRLVQILALGGAQGFLGWYMVQSGLADRTEVSQYRLAAHLGLAFILFGLSFWTARDVIEQPEVRDRSPCALHSTATSLCALVFCQVLLGALTAGLRAGYRFNTWPLMEGHFVPNGAALLRPFWRNVFENPATVQFDHRVLAYVIAATFAATWIWARTRSQRPVRLALDLALAAVAVQVLLGIWTLVTVVPLPLGLLHQTGALVVFAATLNLVHVTAARRAPKFVISSPTVPIQSLGSDP